jgi:pimeloyl-ACP methyl ester carboxylesterase
MARRNSARNSARKSARRLASTEWERFEKSLLRESATVPGARKRGTSARFQPQADATEDEVLRRFAQRSQLERSRGGPLSGNVVFLHGITGADLAVTENAGKPKSVWVSIPQMIFGGIRKLKLAANGADESNASLEVRPTGVNKQFYARAIVALRAKWNVESYAYDWRKDIDQASDGLAKLIQERFANQPVHLVAHSMGGLVARNFIKRHPPLWKTMRDATLTRGGRLVMLGTPNYGSYAIAQVLTGTDALLARLERFDLRNNMAELLDVTNSFLGSYMLLPAHGKLPSSVQPLYEKGTWGATPAISQAHLNRTFDFYKTLDSAATIDSERMLYVAGVNQTTISSIEIASPGEFKYGFTLAGDGRVPHALGLLDGVQSYYVDEVHGDLARNEQILRELDDLLKTGRSAVMATKPNEATRGRVALDRAPPASSYRSGADRAALDILEEMASRTRAANSEDALSEREKQIAADALLHAALGARTEMIERRAPVEDLGRAEPRRAASRPRLGVRVSFGGIESVKTPLAVVGHYRGVKPTNALGAIDNKLNNWISLAVKRAMISGHVGETFIIPTEGRAVGAQAVIVAGMGDYGRFSPDFLREIMANVAQASAALGRREVSSVLIGAGEGNMSVEQALKGLVEGFCAGLAELKQSRPEDVGTLKDLRIVEFNSERFLEIDQELKRLVEAKVIKDVELRYRAVTPAEKRRARISHESSCQKQFEQMSRGEGGKRALKLDEIRITVEFDKEKSEFRFSALTDGAVVPSRPVVVTTVVVEETARMLAEAQSRREQRERGRVLFDYIFPRDLEYLFDSGAVIRMIVDPTSAAIPWEMACLPGVRAQGTPRWFGTDRQLTRQFKTLLSQSVGVISPRSERIRALVIADPAPEPEWQLSGARTEGRIVANLLRGIGNQIGGAPDDSRAAARGPRVGKQAAESAERTSDIIVDAYIGCDDASPADLIGKLVSGQYDIVHFCGHGNYNAEDPEQSGWLLSEKLFVTAKDIFRARSAPWLIVANACYSGRLRQSAPYPSLDAAQRGASIAEAFMDRGVRNYLGTGWTVDDEQAVRFASVFYRDLLRNMFLADAVTAARKAVFSDLTGSTWGAYQFYGDPNDRLRPRPETERRAKVRATSKKK